MRAPTTPRTSSRGIDEAVADLLRAQPECPRVPLHLQGDVVLAAIDLADSIATRYRGRGVDVEDLRQVARLALVGAVARYRPAQGSFTAFAVPTLVGEVKRHFRDHGWVVRPPRSLQEGRAAVTAAQEELRHLHGRQPTTAEVAEMLGVDDSTVRETQLCASGFRPASLDAPLAGTGSCLGDLLVDPDDPIEHVELKAMLRDGLRILGERDRLVLRLRFEEELSQAAIGERIGVSQMQVSRILATITERLRLHLQGASAA